MMTAGRVRVVSVLDVIDEEDERLLHVVEEEREEADLPPEVRPRGHILDSS